MLSHKTLTVLELIRGSYPSYRLQRSETVEAEEKIIPASTSMSKFLSRLELTGVRPDSLLGCQASRAKSSAPGSELQVSNGPSAGSPASFRVEGCLFLFNLGMPGSTLPKDLFDARIVEIRRQSDSIKKS
jgi:hypothetical protein